MWFVCCLCCAVCECKLVVCVCLFMCVRGLFCCRVQLEIVITLAAPQSSLAAPSCVYPVCVCECAYECALLPHENTHPSTQTDKHTHTQLLPHLPGPVAVVSPGARGNAPQLYGPLLCLRVYVCV